MAKYRIDKNKVQDFKKWFNHLKENHSKTFAKHNMKAGRSSNGEFVFIIENFENLSEKNKNFINEKVSNFRLQLKFEDKIKLLEKLSGFKVLITEADEADKNFAVESLTRISEDLDQLKTDIASAIDKVNNLNGQDVILTKLQGLDQIVDSAMVDVAESIARITGMQTAEDKLSEDVQMTSQDAIQDIDDVKKLTDKDITVVINDDAKKQQTT